MVGRKGNYPEMSEEMVGKFSGNSPTYAHLQHSISFDHGSPKSLSRYRTSRGTANKLRSNPLSPSTAWISLCYLPPFSVCNNSSSSVGKFSGNTRYSTSNSRNLIYELDNRYVDELIEEANVVWKRDLLAAYRTQWSCVGRLRAEIGRLRSLLRECESTVEGLRRENHQLKTKLLQSE